MELGGNLTGEESCELIRAAIEVLDHGIRDRTQNVADHYGGDVDHIARIKRLEVARKNLVAALDCCQ